jgi:glycosyltransferase involved in cell wall biosynthesis
LVRELLSLHRERPLDVVHGFYSTFPGYAACAFQALTGVPAVVSCFGRDVNPGMDSHAVGASMTYGTLAQAACVVATNRATRARVLSYARRPPDDRVRLVPMGVDEELFEPSLDGAAARAALGLDGRSIVLSLVSSMLPEKQVDVVVGAVAPVLRARDAQLVVCGPDYDGGAGSAQRAREVAADLGAGDAVSFAGRQPHDRVPLYLAAADVVVDARRVDNFSSSLLEAVAMAKPAVASRPALETLQGDTSAFRSFPEGGAAELAAHVDELLGDEDARAAAEEASRRWWLENRERYGIAGATAELVRIYESCAPEVAARR